MKQRIFYCAILLGAALVARAEGLKKEHVAADAKWLVHLDMDALRKTEIGDFLLNRFVLPKVNEASGELKINASNILQRVTSLTAYGADFTKGVNASGVLLISSDDETQKALEGVLVAQILADTNGPVKKLEADQAMYSLANQVFLSPLKGGTVVISKSQAEVEVARDLLSGKSPSLASTKTFSEFPSLSNSFVFLGIADTLNVPNPFQAKAKVLQMADGGQIALGERDQDMFLQLALRGKTAEVTRQIQQVFEGMLALVTLGQPEIPELMDLAKSTKVSSVDQVVSIQVQYPAAKVIAKMNDLMAPKPPQEKAPKQKVKSKNKKLKQPKPEVDPEKPEAPQAEPAKPDAPKPEAEVSAAPAPAEPSK